VFHHPHFFRGCDGRPDEDNLALVKSRPKVGRNPEFERLTSDQPTHSELAARLELVVSSLRIAEAENDRLRARISHLEALDVKRYKRERCTREEDDGEDAIGGQRTREAQKRKCHESVVEDNGLGLDTDDEFELKTGSMLEDALLPETSSAFFDHIMPSLSFQTFPVEEVAFSKQSSTADSAADPENSITVNEALEALGFLPPCPCSSYWHVPKKEGHGGLAEEEPSEVM
jgi:hypothetical protein